MNLANQLTMLRMALAAAVFVALLSGRPGLHAIALALFLTAITTDIIDGYIARTTHTISAFGKVADPIADKILIIGTLIALIRTRELAIPLWGVFLIIARELVIGGVRILSSAQGKPHEAEAWGKWKMVVQSVSVLLMIFILVLHEYVLGIPDWVLKAPYGLTILCAAATWVSALLYIQQARKTLENSWT